MMLEDGHRRGDRCYDLGTGSHDTKQPWRTTVQASYRFTYFPAAGLAGATAVVESLAPPPASRRAGYCLLLRY